MDFTWIELLNIAGVIGVLAYWEAKELRTSRADKSSGRHSLPVRVAIRLLLPLAGGLMVLQLLGFDPLVFNIGSDAMLSLYIIGQVIFWAGAIIGVWARETIGKHWAHAAEYQIMEQHELITAGPYARLRHPIYTALFSIFFGAQLIVGSGLTVLSLPLLWFVYWQADKEEVLLSDAFGQKYDEYCQYTGKILPKI